MTREEAIQRLVDLQDGSGQTYEAIRMAIESLSAESNGDLISREDAIKAVEQEYKIDRGHMADDYTYGFNQAIQYVSDIILHDLPSAEVIGVGRYENAMQTLREMPKYLNGIKAKQIQKISVDRPKYETFCGVPMEEAYKVMRGYSLGEYVEVVRCKDCRHHGMSDCPMCEGAITEDYMWCNYGQRKK